MKKCNAKFAFFSGNTQDIRQGDGSEDEPAKGQPAEYASRGAADEQTEASEHFRVCLIS